MTKGKFIVIIISMIIVFSTIIYLNYENIENFINNKQWEIVDSIATIIPNKYLNISSAGNKLIVIESDKFSAYTNNKTPSFVVDTSFKSIVTNNENDYGVIAEEGGNKVILINENEKLWEAELNGELLGVSVNKNGYVACIYSKSGYKSLIKVFKPNGEEMFTNYLASTYAVDVEISNDNKYLAVAEVNAEGINLNSSIKIIDMNNVQNDSIKTIDLDSNSLILDIEYTDKNELLVLEDSKIEKINNDYERNTISEYNHNSVSHVTIENREHAIIVEKKDTGIFSTEYILKIYDSSINEPKEHELSGTPKQIYAQNKTIALDMGNEILFLNTNGKLIKRCSLEGQVKEIKLYDNGNMVGLIFRDRIEIVKL